MAARSQGTPHSKPKAKPTVILCAEAVPWRCHRSLIGDALVVRGWQVMDLMSERSAKPHKLRDFAKVKGTAAHLSGRGKGTGPWRGVQRG